MSILRRSHITDEHYPVISIHHLDPAVLSPIFTLHNGRKVCIRPMQYADIPYLHQAVNDSIEHLSFWLLFGSTHYTLGTAKQWIENAIQWWEKGMGYEFLIIDQNTKAVLGGVSLNPMEPFLRHANLGYWIVESATGQGLASLAAMFAAHLGFNHLKIERIELVIDTQNQASLSVAKKIGAHFEGTARRRLRFGHTFYDAHIFSLIPEQFIS